MKIKWKTKLILSASMLLMVCLFSACGVVKERESNEISRKTENEADIENRIAPDVTMGDIAFGGKSRQEARAEVEMYAESANQPKTEWAHDENDWEVFVPGEAGLEVDVEQTLDRLMAANRGEQVTPVMQEIPLTVDEQQLRDNLVQLAYFKTKISDQKPERINNISLAAEAVNATVLQPGDTFSFNQTVGRTTRERGYQEAPIYVKDDSGETIVEMGYGGGICQVSTTIYNAASDSGLEILERHEHSRDVQYVRDGLDASVSIGTQDLVFQNVRDRRIMLKMVVENDMVKAYVLERGEL